MFLGNGARTRLCSVFHFAATAATLLTARRSVARCSTARHRARAPACCSSVRHAARRLLARPAPARPARHRRPGLHRRRRPGLHRRCCPGLHRHPGLHRRPGPCARLLLGRPATTGCPGAPPPPLVASPFRRFR
jgi:hypothetical protein